MEYIDEDVAYLRRLAERKAYCTLETGLYVDETWIEFARTELPGGKCAAVLPKSFALLGEDAAAIKYPSVHRPQVIYSNSDGTVNFTFSHADEPIKPAQLLACAAQFKEAIKRTNPAILFGDSGEAAVGETKLHWFEFQSFTLDMRLYNFMYLTIIDKKVLHGAFNCPAPLAEEWKVAVRQVIQTIDDLTMHKEVIPR